MKKNIFAETYAQTQELKAQYKAAEEAGSEAGMQAARDTYNTLMKSIEGLGATACRIWREYETARENENARLDINEVVWDRDVESLVSCMRENGISEFTFSSGWSSAVETAWLFTQNSCEVVGMAEVNGSMDYFAGKREKKHGYLFKVK